MADVLSYNDYYPFGYALPGRSASSSNYRYGFQGQEKDDEIKGEGLSVNYKHRMHDPRVGRFFAVDPLFKKYAYYSPYVFSGNRVIDAIDLEGSQPKQKRQSNTTVVDNVTVTKNGAIVDKVEKLISINRQGHYMVEENVTTGKKTIITGYEGSALVQYKVRYTYIPRPSSENGLQYYKKTTIVEFTKPAIKENPYEPGEDDGGEDDVSTSTSIIVGGKTIEAGKSVTLDLPIPLTSVGEVKGPFFKKQLIESYVAYSPEKIVSDLKTQLGKLKKLLTENENLKIRINYPNSDFIKRNFHGEKSLEAVNHLYENFHNTLKKYLGSELANRLSLARKDAGVTATYTNDAPAEQNNNDSNSDDIE